MLKIKGQKKGKKGATESGKVTSSRYNCWNYYLYLIFNKEKHPEQTAEMQILSLYGSSTELSTLHYAGPNKKVHI